MLNTIFFFLYGAVFLIVLWQAFRVIGRGHQAANQMNNSSLRGKEQQQKHDRTGKITIHPEILDSEGRITNEELLTVRFSSDNDQPPSGSAEETSAE